MASKVQIAGRGKKQCPSCKKYVGVRTSVCSDCNHNFIKITKEVDNIIKKEDNITVTAEGIPPEQMTRLTFCGKFGWSSWKDNIIITPAGQPPVKIVDGNVEDWIKNMMKIRPYAPEALIYFGRFYYNNHLDKITSVVSEMSKIVKEEVLEV